MHSITHMIRTIILTGQAGTQADIQKALKKQQQVVSQSKISRLLHQMGAVKLVDNEGETHYRLPHETGLIHELTTCSEKSIPKQWILEASVSDSLIIIHTIPGAAAMVARIIDQHRLQLAILGTIAGDDTIFVAAKPSQNLNEVVTLIAELFGV